VSNTHRIRILLLCVILIIIVFDILLFQSLFGKISLYFKIILFYSSIVLFLLLIILIITASSVSFEANKSYKLFNKLFITIGNNKQIWIHMKIKVFIVTFNLFIILINFLIIFLLSIFWQLLSLIERIAKNEIGFYCWKIFIFDYFRVYEVSFQKIFCYLKHNCFNLKFFVLRYWYWCRPSFSRLSKYLFSTKTKSNSN
jgi:hypothetical protein